MFMVYRISVALERLLGTKKNNVRQRTTILYSAIVFLFLSSCTRYYYKPNAVNAPLFTDGGQAHVAVVGSVGSANGDYANERTRYVFDECALAI